MNPEHQTFILFKDWGSTIAKMSVEEKAAVFDALFLYTKGKPYTVPSSVSFFFEFMIEQIEKNDEKWTETQERCKNAGRLGGLAKSNNAKQRPANSSDPKQPLAPLGDPKQPLATPSNNVNVNVNDNVTGLSKDNYKEISPNGDTKKRVFSLRDVDGIIDEYLIIRDREDIRKVIKEFFAAKKQAKKTISETAVRRNIKKALDLANNNPDQVKELFELALERGWQGIYEDNSQSGIAKATRQKIEGVDWMALYGKEDAQ